MRRYPEIEKNVISLMLEHRDIQKVYSRKLTVNDFSLEECRLALEAIQECQANNLHLDVPVAFQKYELTNVISYETFIDKSKIKLWFEVLRQSSVKVDLSVGARQVVEMLEDDETDVNDAHRKLVDVNTSVRVQLHGEKQITKQQIVEEFSRKMEVAANSSGVVGLPITGQYKLDEMLNGCERTDFIVLAGRPGMGKTAHTIDIVRECMNRNLSLRYYSLEMSADQLLGRLVSNLSGCRYSNLSRGIIDIKSAYNDALGDFLNSKVEIIDKGGMSWFDIESNGIASAESESVDVVIIDFLQLVKGNGKHSETETLNEVARGCKALAKELNAVVFGLAQLNREVEKRPNKIPQLSDLKQSGAIEEAADKVLMYYRPKYYGLDPMQVFNTDRYDGVNEDVIIVAKNRSGATGVHNTTFEYDSMSFVDKTEQDREYPKVENNKINPPEMDEIPF